MADFDSSLPIRSEVDGLDARVHVKIVDGTTSPAVNQTKVDDNNRLWVFARGNDPTASDVGARHSELGHYAVDGVYDVTNNTDPSNFGVIAHQRNATPADSHQTVRVTSANPDSDTIDESTVFALDTNSFMKYWDATGSQWVRVQGDSGSLNVNITNTDVDVNIDGVYDAGTNADPDNVGLIAHERNATPGDAQQTKRLTAITNDTVTALDVSLHDETGAAYSQTNPLPVTLADPAAGSSDVHDPNTTAAVAKDATVTHDYVVTAGKVLYLKKWKAVGSGKIKAVLQIETGVGTDTYDAIDWDFNSTAFPACKTQFPQPIEVAAGITVRISITNNDNAAFDVYSFINGYEV
jgi:hypothetical protein